MCNVDINPDMSILIRSLVFVSLLYFPAGRALVDAVVADRGVDATGTASHRDLAMLKSR